MKADQQDQHDETVWQPGDVAAWHRLGSLPDNVTEEGEIVQPHVGQRDQIAKDQLRAEIARLRDIREPVEVASLVRLAASYLLAGDAETARRYVGKAQEVLATARPPTPD